MEVLGCGCGKDLLCCDQQVYHTPAAQTQRQLMPMSGPKYAGADVDRKCAWLQELSVADCWCLEHKLLPPGTAMLTQGVLCLQECDRLEAQLLTAQQALAATADHASTIEELDALRAQLTSAREQLNASQASAAEELQSVRAQLDSVQSQLEASQQSCSSMEDELETAKAGLQSSRQQLESSVDRCNALEQAAREAAAEAGRVNVSHEAEMQQLQEQLRESSRVAEQLQQQVSSAEASRLEVSTPTIVPDWLFMAVVCCRATMSVVSACLH